MSDKLNLYGKKVNGKLKIDSKEAIDNWLKFIPEGEDLVIKIRVQKNVKSFRQVRLLYHCLRAISQHTGHDVEEIKTMLKLKAGLCFSHNIEGKEITVCKSISDFSLRELSEFIQFIDRWSIQALSYPLLNNEDIQFLKL